MPLGYAWAAAYAQHSSWVLHGAVQLIVCCRTRWKSIWKRSWAEQSRAEPSRRLFALIRVHKAAKQNTRCSQLKANLSDWICIYPSEWLWVCRVRISHSLLLKDSIAPELQDSRPPDLLPPRPSGPSKELLRLLPGPKCPGLSCSPAFSVQLAIINENARKLCKPRKISCTQVRFLPRLKSPRPSVPCQHFWLGCTGRMRDIQLYYIMATQRGRLQRSIDHYIFIFSFNF